VVTDVNQETPVRPSGIRIAAIGCFMAFIGFFSGGMIGVLVSKAVAFFAKAPSCDGIPTCNWYIYMAVGGALGAISLPWLVVGALRSAPHAPPTSDNET
jgi:hypothetical protein